MLSMTRAAATSFATACRSPASSEDVSTLRSTGANRAAIRFNSAASGMAAFAVIIAASNSRLFMTLLARLSASRRPLSEGGFNGDEFVPARIQPAFTQLLNAGQRRSTDGFDQPLRRRLGRV